MLTGLNSAKDNSNETLLKVKEQIEEADFKFDKELYMKAHAQCERILSGEQENPAAEYYMAYAEYKLLLIGMTNNDKSAFGDYYSRAIAHAKNLSAEKEYKSEAYALLAAIYMMKLATDHAEGPSLAPKIHGLLDEAQQVNPNNPRVHIVRGHMLKNTPEFFGGSLKGAIKEFEYSISLFENNTDVDSETFPAWGYLESIVEIGNIYSSLKDYKAAKKAYEKALEVAPDYGYVKYKLLPELESKLTAVN